MISEEEYIYLGSRLVSHGEHQSPARALKQQTSFAKQIAKIAFRFAFLRVVAHIWQRALPLAEAMALRYFLTLLRLNFMFTAKHQTHRAIRYPPLPSLFFKYASPGAPLRRLWVCATS